jgi:uncharacterized damage-inducible protein DinB
MRIRIVTVGVVGLSLVASVASAQGMDLSMKGQYEMVRGFVTKSAAMMPEADYGFKPTPAVRSFAQILGHIANSVGMLCVSPSGMKSPLAGDAEKITAKAEMVKALASAFAACDKAWGAMTPAWNSEPVDLFGNKTTKAAALAFNTAHTWEHYGNLVTYLRLKNLVPPSSAGGGN